VSNVGTTWFEIQTKNHELWPGFSPPPRRPSRRRRRRRPDSSQTCQGCHHQKDERALFPRLRAGQGESGLVASMVTEHAQARELVSRVDAAAKAYVDGARDRLGELGDSPPARGRRGPPSRPLPPSRSARRRTSP
jgi:cytochrome c553